MKQLRILGSIMFIAGALLLVLLFTPYKEWAANHSIASFVSATDKRVGNSIDTPVDMPMSIAGDVVMMFAGAWVGLFVPHMLKKFQAGYTLQAQQPQQYQGY